MSWPLAIAMGAGVAGQFLGQTNANEANRDIANQATATNVMEAKRNRIFQSHEAQKNREFQRTMSNTAHQRQMKDLVKAGLNPILAATGGASSPSGSQGSGAQATAETARMENTMQGMASSALEFARLKEDVGLIRAQKNKAQTEERVIRKGIPEAEMKNQLYDAVKPMLNKAKEIISSSSKSVSKSKHDFGSLLRLGIGTGSNSKQNVNPPPKSNRWDAKGRLNPKFKGKN